MSRKKLLTTISLVLLLFTTQGHGQIVDSLKTSILESLACDDKIVQLLDALPKTKENINFLLHNIDLILTIYDYDGDEEICIPIVEYLANNEKLVNIELIAHAMMANKDEFKYRMYFLLLSQISTDHVYNIHFLDSIFCLPPQDKKIYEAYQRGRNVLLYEIRSQRKAIANLDDPTYVVMEIKEDVNEQEFECLVRRKFPLFYEHNLRLGAKVVNSKDYRYVAAYDLNDLDKDIFSEYIVSSELMGYCRFMQWTN